MTRLTTDDQAPVTGGGLIGAIVGLHDGVFGSVARLGDGWFTGFAARFALASVLLVYYFHSGTQKLGEGLFGFVNPSLGAYASILPTQMEQAGYDPSALPWWSHPIVHMGTWGEIVIPLLVVAGLFSRIMAIGMLIIVIVQSYVDIAGHGLDQTSIGTMFDRLPDSVIFDQRLMWVTLLALIIVNGPGRLSVDHLLGRWYHNRT